MSEQLSDVAQRGQVILSMLPDDPAKATAEMLTHAAVVCISAGMDDERAVRGLQAALTDLRGRGLGEERH